MIYLKCKEYFELCRAAFIEKYNQEKKAQFFRNYDYTDSKSGPGTSVWQAIDDGKVKSIDEWRKKNRKRRKKTLEKILKTRL